jgi:hypothetical protein
MKPRKHFRAGDLVAVINRQRVVRVGYPKSVRDYAAELDNTAMTQWIQALAVVASKRGHVTEYELGPHLNKLSLIQLANSTGPKRPGWIKMIASVLAYNLAQVDGFGGRERSIHTESFDANRYTRDLPLTRTYYPPSGWDDAHEPGGLASPVHHVLLRITNDAHFGQDWETERAPPDFATQVWVHEGDVIDALAFAEASDAQKLLQGVEL